MAKLLAAVALACICSAALIGCGSGEEPVPQEPAASQTAAQESASKWTPEQVEKFAELNKQARGEGAEGKGVTSSGQTKKSETKK